MNIFKKLLQSVLVRCGNLYSFHSDKKLINIYLNSKDECAFDELVNRYIDRIYALCFRITKNKEITEDVVQEIFVTLSQKLHTFRAESSFSTWLYRISTNAALMKIRKEKRHINEEISEDVIFDNGNTKKFVYVAKDSSKRPDDYILKKEAEQTFNNALNKLPETYRLVIHLKDIDGFSYSQIANILNISTQAVKSRIHRARLVLREDLSEYFNEWSGN